jgi:16S rRNA (cytosine967-C5)-methyltransferase
MKRSRPRAPGSGASTSNVKAKAVSLRRKNPTGSGASEVPSSITPRSRSSAAGIQTRRAALEILLLVEREGAFADVLLGHRLGDFAVPDRRLITQLVLGTIAWRGRLDYEIGLRATRRLDQLSPDVLMAMRMALFQLRILTRIPPHAAVDTAVTLAREASGAGAAGFVNAILRNALRQPVPLPSRSADEIGYLSTVHSHPRWLVDRFVEWFGIVEAEAVMVADNQAAPNVLRLNLARGSAEDLAVRIDDAGMRIARRGHFPETLILSGAPMLESSCYQAGIFHLQSEASQIVARLLDPASGSTIVDCAAAPGGKSTHLAELAGPGARVVAFDLNFSGLKTARRIADRLGHRTISFARVDCASALPLRPQTADYVLLDAPCSGIGTLREHPEIRWRVRADDFARMGAIQSRMLENAAALVRPGGAIVYAVCSFAPEEGVEVVRGFLRRHPEFALDRDPPEAARLSGFLDSDGFLRTRPDRDALDGFFAARLLRPKA